MRVVSEQQLAILLGALSGIPRVVVGGNFATRGGQAASFWPVVDPADLFLGHAHRDEPC